MSEHGKKDQPSRNPIPDRAEIRALLEKFFVGPITERTVDLVQTEFQLGVNSLSEEQAIAGHFNSPTRWLGKAWYERIPADRRFPNRVDQVLLIANGFSSHDRSFPPPRMFCPIEYVGTWEQVEPVPTIESRCWWELAADDSFRSNSPEVPTNKKYWAITRTPRGDTSDERLLLKNEPDWGCWDLVRVKVTPTELTGLHLGATVDTPFRLRRIGQVP